MNYNLRFEKHDVTPYLNSLIADGKKVGVDIILTTETEYKGNNIHLPLMFEDANEKKSQIGFLVTDKDKFQELNPIVGYSKKHFKEIRETIESCLYRIAISHRYSIIIEDKEGKLVLGTSYCTSIGMNEVFEEVKQLLHGHYFFAHLTEKGLEDYITKQFNI